MIFAATFSGWIMVLEAPSLREAQRIANRSVDSFGGIVGVDRPNVHRASEDEINQYRAMA